jgi:hypothetical protein
MPKGNDSRRDQLARDRRAGLGGIGGELATGTAVFNVMAAADL